MKLAYEFFTIVVFFVSYYLYDIYIATALLMLLFTAKAAHSYFFKGRIDTVDLITVIVVLVAGSLTLYFANPAFIKYKPTVINLAFAAALLIGHFVFKKNIFHLLLGKQLELPAAAWQKLLYVWVSFFIFIALLNAYVAHFFSEKFWVNFKLWGFIFPLIAMIISGVLLAPYLKELDKDKKDKL